MRMKMASGDDRMKMESGDDRMKMESGDETVHMSNPVSYIPWRYNATGF
jgi:hypothetical protein